MLLIGFGMPNGLSLPESTSIYVLYRSIGVIAYVLLSGLSPCLGDCDAETWENVTRAEPITFDEEEVRGRPSINGLTQI